MIIMPFNKNIDNLIAITEKEHNKYMELVEANMDKELTKIKERQALRDRINQLEMEVQSGEE